MKKDSTVYLRHILDAVSRIESYIKDISCEDFLENAMVQAAVIREMEIIGEAAKRLSPDFKTGHPGIPWRKMAGMRDKLVHDYMGVDIDAVWDTVDRDLPPLKSAIIEVMDSNESD